MPEPTPELVWGKTCRVCRVVLTRHNTHKFYVGRICKLCYRLEDKR